MNKSYIIERDVLTEVWVRHKFTIEAPNEKVAVDILEKLPDDVTNGHDNIIEVECETLQNTSRIITSGINVNKIISHSHQPKLTFK